MHAFVQGQVEGMYLLPDWLSLCVPPFARAY